MKTALMASISWQPSLEPPRSKGTGTHHTVEAMEIERERGWKGNCLGDELPLHSTIHKHIEF